MVENVAITIKQKHLRSMREDIGLLTGYQFQEVLPRNPYSSLIHYSSPKKDRLASVANSGIVYMVILVTKLSLKKNTSKNKKTYHFSPADKFYQEFIELFCHERLLVVHLLKHYIMPRMLSISKTAEEKKLH